MELKALMMWPTGSRKSRRTQQGLALVEVLVAVMILSTSSIFVLQALSRAAVLEREIRNLSRVQLFAADKMAEFEARVFEGKKLKKKYTGRFIEEEQDFQWRVTALPSIEFPSSQRVSLAVSWKQGAEAYQRNFTALVPVVSQEEFS